VGLRDRLGRLEVDRPRGAPLYRTEVVAQRTISREVDAQGHLDVPERIVVPAPAPGRLARILVKPGEVVRSGQVLAELDALATAMAVGAARRSLEAMPPRTAWSSQRPRAWGRRSHPTRRGETGAFTPIPRFGSVLAAQAVDRGRS
jgi:hypothetical protein